MLVVWSPKGGSGTSVVAAGLALVLARAGGARLVDLRGDQPGLLGMAADPTGGFADWLAAGPDAPAEALGHLAVEAAPDLALLTPGTGSATATGHPGTDHLDEESGHRLATALRNSPVPVVVDSGTARDPFTLAVVASAATSVVVVRPCYLALRRAVSDERLATSDGVVTVVESGRALGVRDVGSVLGQKVLATVPARREIARVVDAGTFVTRLPPALTRPFEGLLRETGLLPPTGAADGAPVS